jgi:hypothetical protein
MYNIKCTDLNTLFASQHILYKYVQCLKFGVRKHITVKVQYQVQIVFDMAQFVGKRVGKL